MDKLADLGWHFRFDTFETYWKPITEDLQICVSKHINSQTWNCCLINYSDGLNDEITVNDNSTLEWVLSFTKLLLEAELS